MPTQHRYQIGEKIIEQSSGTSGTVLQRKWFVALFDEQASIENPIAEPAYWVKFADGREKNVLDSELK